MGSGCDVQDDQHVRTAFFTPIKTGGLFVAQHLDIRCIGNEAERIKSTDFLKYQNELQEADCLFLHYFKRITALATRR